MARVWQPDWLDRLAQRRVETQAAQIGFVPPAPTVTASAAATSVTLTWESAGDGGQALTGWQIRQRVGSDGWEDWTTITGSDADTTTHTVSGLTVSTTYSFQIRAVNASGAGVASEVVSVTTTGAPQAPVALGAVAAGYDSVRLVWAAGSDSGSAVTSWQYRIGTGAAVDIAGSDATTVSHVVTGLNPDTSYTFQVRAQNANGDGAWSPEASTTTLGGIPGTPSVTVTGTTSTTITVAWQAGEVPDGVPITGWQHRHRVFNGTWETWVAETATTTGVTVTGLMSGTTYEIEVRAQNSFGNSPAVARVAGTDAIPGAVVGLAADAGWLSADVSWSPPTSGAETYQYRYQTGGVWTAWTTVGAALSVTVTGLSLNTTVTVEVRAVNTAGIGPVSAVTGTTRGHLFTGDGVMSFTSDGHVTYVLAEGSYVAAYEATVQTVAVGLGGTGAFSDPFEGGNGGHGGGAGEVRQLAVTVTGTVTVVYGTSGGVDTHMTVGGVEVISAFRGYHGNEGAVIAPGVFRYGSGGQIRRGLPPGPFAADGANGYQTSIAPTYIEGGHGGGGHINWQPPGLTTRYGVAGEGGDGAGSPQRYGGNGRSGGPAAMLVRWKPDDVAEPWQIPVYTAYTAG